MLSAMPLKYELFFPHTYVPIRHTFAEIGFPRLAIAPNMKYFLFPREHSLRKYALTTFLPKPMTGRKTTGT